jgi:seipin
MMTKMDVEGDEKADGGVGGLVRKSVELGITTTREKLGHVTAKTQETVVEVAETTKKVLYNLLSTLLTVLLVVSASLFMYGAFYYAYMPKEIHEVDINFQFDACDTAMGMCSYPNASVYLDSKTKQLMTGQPYSINMQLEVPDSPTNQDVGMFMSCIHVKTKDKKTIDEKCRSNMLEYRSDLLRIIETLVFSPFLLSSSTSQRQWISINYFEMFMDNPHSPATNIDLEIRSKFFQVYSASLQVHAEFSGLRRILYRHPWFSTVVGVSSNMIILSIIILISWTTFFAESTRPVAGGSGLEGEVDESDEEGDVGDVDQPAIED